MEALKLEEMPYYTYDDYILWEGRWELIHGVAYAMSPAPMIKHQNISNKIAWELQNVFKNCKQYKALLPVDWKISEDTTVQPDNLVICEDETNKAYIIKAPKIIFEVLSKSTAKKDEGVKFRLYEAEGVNYYIIVNPDDNVAKTYELKEGRYIKIGDLTHEKVEFNLKDCEEHLEFDFSKIWD